MKKYLSFLKKIVAVSLLLAILFAGTTTSRQPIDENYGISLCSDHEDNDKRNKN